MSQIRLSSRADGFKILIFEYDMDSDIATAEVAVISTQQLKEPASVLY